MKYVLVGLALVAAVVGFTLWENQGSRLIMNGSIRKVRLQKVDDANTAVILEVRLNNPSDLPFEIKAMKLTLDGAHGPVDGTLFRAKDLDAFFDFYKASLGTRFNDSLRIGERLVSRTLVDRTIAASFPLPEDQVVARKNMEIRLDAIDGAVPSIIAETQVRKD